MATAADSPNLSSPWSHIEESPSPSSDQSSLKISGDGSGRANVVDQEATASPQEINSAWKTVSSGAGSADSVMWAESWPALSEAIKIPLKSSSSDSLKGLANGSSSAPIAPVIKSLKPISGNSNPVSSGNNSLPLRQKGMKRHSGGISSNIHANNDGGNGVGIISNSTRPAFPESTHNTSDKVPASGSSHSDVDHGSGTGRIELSRQNSSNRRGNSGGNGGHQQNNFGNRGTHEWNARSFNGGRDIYPQNQHQQQPRALSRPFLRPQAPGPAPFIPPPPPIRPFGNPMGYHDISHPVFYVPPPLSFVPPSPLYFPMPDLQLRTILQQQLEYYFSPENLCRDVFLRQNMDEEGWVSVSLVASFRRVVNLTNSIPLILDSLRGSMIVEVQGDKIRRRNDWRNWPPLAMPANPRPQGGRSNGDSPPVQLTHTGLEEVNSGEHNRGPPIRRSVSGEMSGQLPEDGNSERSPRTQEVSPSTDYSEVI